jgi:hypothetical protein
MESVLEKARRRASLRDMRTAVTARIRSKPTIEGQRYLDLYVLQRDRFRWKRLMDQAVRSIQSIDMALNKLGFNPEYGHGPSPAISTGPAVGGVGGRTIDLGTAIKRKRSA